MKYGKAYGGQEPELIEGDIFRIIVGFLFLDKLKNLLPSN
jgi:hypothetical protein